MDLASFHTFHLIPFYFLCSKNLNRIFKNATKFFDVLEYFKFGISKHKNHQWNFRSFRVSGGRNCILNANDCEIDVWLRKNCHKAARHQSYWAGTRILWWSNRISRICTSNKIYNVRTFSLINFLVRTLWKLLYHQEVGCRSLIFPTERALTRSSRGSRTDYVTRKAW